MGWVIKGSQTLSGRVICSFPDKDGFIRLDYPGYRDGAALTIFAFERLGVHEPQRSGSLQGS